MVELQVLSMLMSDLQFVLKLLTGTTFVAGEADVLCSDINHLDTSTFISDQSAAFRIGAAGISGPLDVQW